MASIIASSALFISVVVYNYDVSRAESICNAEYMCNSQWCREGQLTSHLNPLPLPTSPSSSSSPSPSPSPSPSRSPCSSTPKIHYEESITSCKVGLIRMPWNASYSPLVLGTPLLPHHTTPHHTPHTQHTHTHTFSGTFLCS